MDISSNEDDYIDLGIPMYGHGESVSVAFGLSRVFQTGWLIMKQPALALWRASTYSSSHSCMLSNLVFSFAQLFLELGAAVSPELAQAFGGFTDLITIPFFLLLNMLAYAGAYIAFGHFIRNDQVSYITLYTSIGAAVRALLLGILQGLIIVGMLAVFMIPGIIGMLMSPVVGAFLIVFGLILSIVPLIYIGLGLQLSVHALVLDQVGILEAMRVSWRAAAGARMELFVLGLVFGLLYVIANCCLIVPILFVSAIHMAGTTAGWMAYSRSLDETRTYSFFEGIQN